MLKKLTPEQQEKILDCAMAEFGKHGKGDAKVSKIASDAGVSVGVIYKYFTDKDGLFDACMEKCLSLLEEVLGNPSIDYSDLEEALRSILQAIRHFSAKYPSAIHLYHQITTGHDMEDALTFSKRIESISAQLYTEVISKAKSKGFVSREADPSMFAFFFDNLLMMLHFSYASRYYQSRYNVFCGKDILDPAEEKRIEDQMVLFLMNALGIRRGETVES